MPDLPLTPEQLATLRDRLGLRPGDPDPTADDLIIVLQAEEITAAEARRWSGTWRYQLGDGEP